MELSFNLEKMFPTEDSRFDAYKKWIIFTSIFYPLFSILSGILDFTSQYSEILLLFLLLFCLFGIVILLFGLYVFIYILWKSKTLSTVLRMILGIVIGMILSVCTGGLFAIIALFFNWPRLKEYRQKNGRFIKDQLILFCIPFGCLILGSIGAVGSLITIRSEGFAWFLVILAYLIYLIAIPTYCIHMYERERASGNTFYNTTLQENIAGMFLLFCIVAITAHLHSHTFNGDTVLHDISGATDPSGMNVDGFTTATPDMSLTDFGDVPNMDAGMYAHSGPDIGFAHHDSSAFTHDAGLGYESPSSSDMQFGTDDMHPDVNYNGSFANPGSDMMGGHFADVFGGTNMADISHIQQHPYMVFNDASIHGDFQICDPNGMPQMSVSDGNILNAEGVTIGHVHTDAVTGTKTFTDMQNTPLYSVDSHGQMFSDNCYVGHTTTSGNVTVMRGINENIIATKDAFNGVWRDIHGKIISQVKPM